MIRRILTSAMVSDGKSMSQNLTYLFFVVSDEIKSRSKKKRLREKNFRPFYAIMK
jgi:hypothetical protein